MKDLQVKDFYYDLPKELIAQHPMEKRDECRLMILGKETGLIEHKKFKDILDYFRLKVLIIIDFQFYFPSTRKNHCLKLLVISSLKFSAITARNYCIKIQFIFTYI